MPDLAGSRVPVGVTAFGLVEAWARHENRPGHMLGGDTPGARAAAGPNTRRRVNRGVEPSDGERDQLSLTCERVTRWDSFRLGRV